MAREAKRGFTYQKRTVDDVRERANARGGGYDSYIKPNFKRYKMKDGKNIIRILPPTWKGAKHYGYDVFLNYGIGPDNASYLSLSKHGLGKDPIAEARAQANREGDDEVAKQLAPRQRILMWVIDRQDEDEGPQILDCPQSLDKTFANLSFDEDTGEIIDLDHPEEGCDVRFYKEGKGLNTKYDGSKAKLMKPGPLGDDDTMEPWLAYIEENSVPDCLNFYDYDHIAQVFNGTAKPKNEDADDDDVKPVAKTKPAARDPDEDDVPWKKPNATLKRKADAKDEDSSSEDDDEEDAPKSRRRAQVKPQDDEDDDEADAPPTKGTSLRDKLKARRKPVDEDDD